MATTIPDSMPEDWLDEGARIRDTDPDDTALRQAMQQAYREGLERLHVGDIMVELKDRCMTMAKGAVGAPESEPTTILPPANHELKAESLTSEPEVT